MTERDSEMSIRALRSEIKALLEGPRSEGIELKIEILQEELEEEIYGDLIIRLLALAITNDRNGLSYVCSSASL